MTPSAVRLVPYKPSFQYAMSQSTISWGKQRLDLRHKAISSYPQVVDTADSGTTGVTVETIPGKLKNIPERWITSVV